jgi:hypothetical protein
MKRLADVSQERLTGTQLTNLLLVRIPERFKNVRVWRQNVIAAVTPDGRLVRSSTRGLADISGIGPGGVRIEIECKAKGDRIRPEQQSFADMIRRHGGIHLIAGDVDGALERLGRELEAHNR